MPYYHKSYASLGHKPKRRWRVFGSRKPERSLRTSIATAACCIIIGAWVGLLIFHPYFRIKHIAVVQTQNINAAALQETVATALARKRWRVLPHNNFFLLDKERLATVIKTKYPVTAVSFKTQFPDTVTLSVTERLAFVIYDDGENYTLVDEEGIPQKTLRAVLIHERKEARIVGEGGGATTSTAHYPDTEALHARFGTYPVLYNQRKEKIDPVVIQGAIAITTYLSQHTDFATHHFIYPRNEFQTLLVVHTGGMIVSFNPVEKLSEQLETFRQAWQRELRKERNKDIRVNARYPGRVYIEEGSIITSPKTDTR